MNQAKMGWKPFIVFLSLLMCTRSVIVLLLWRCESTSRTFSPPSLASNSAAAVVESPIVWNILLMGFFLNFLGIQRELSWKSRNVGGKTRKKIRSLVVHYLIQQFKVSARRTKGENCVWKRVSREKARAFVFQLLSKCRFSCTEICNWELQLT